MQCLHTSVLITYFCQVILPVTFSNPVVHTVICLLSFVVLMLLLFCNIV